MDTCCIFLKETETMLMSIYRKHNVSNTFQWYARDEGGFGFVSYMYYLT